MIDDGIVECIVSHLDVGDCWIWTRALNSAGYGHVGYRGRVYRVHRALYQVLTQVELSPKVQLDHMCRNRACANPDHLDPVTNRENFLRGAHPSARTHRGLVTVRACGHELSTENSYVRPNGTSFCKICNRERVRRHDTPERRAAYRDRKNELQRLRWAKREIINEGS